MWYIKNQLEKVGLSISLFGEAIIFLILQTIKFLYFPIGN